jgi:hypothetical protein
MELTSDSILDNKTLFYYILIIIGIIYAFSTISIELNIILGLIIGCAIVYFLYNDYMKKQEDEIKINSFQEKAILPSPSNNIEKRDDVVKFLFSIQDFYVYNPLAYIEMMNSLENFFRIYDETEDHKENSGLNHTILLNHKKDAINSLHSIIYNFPTNAEYTNKLNKSITILNDLLTKYLDKIYEFHKINLYENGYNINTKIIDKSNIIPYNSYADNKESSMSFTYELV